MVKEIRVVVWNEYRHEKLHPEVAKVYPDGIHASIAKYLRAEGDMQVRTATLDEPHHGLPEAILNTTDVLIWWGHMAHNEVKDEVVDRIQRRVVTGMGLVVLHSGHMSKIFRRLMGTSCELKWREAAENERIWVVEPAHEIAAGLEEHIDIEHEEMYGERFDIPAPNELVFVSWFKGGEVFRSGCCFYRGRGRIFYFRPGHEMYPTYHKPEVLKVIANAVRWTAPVGGPATLLGNVKPLEKID